VLVQNLMKNKWRIAGVNFDHMHMGDLLRMVHAHPDAEIVGISHTDPEKMSWSIATFGIPQDRVFSDYRKCLEKTRPDLVIICPATSDHGEWTERVAPFGAHVLVEKPFAATLDEADRMVAALKATGKQLIINWPLRWYPTHITAERLVREGMIGSLQEVHYYNGNRGPLWHTADKIETEPTSETKSSSWWYQRECGGGSLLDYLGYGVTLGTWFHGGKVPSHVACMTFNPAGLEVDEHSVTVARYDCGLSKYETRWGTFTDPWTAQPQPKCGFVLKGTDGTISSYDYEPSVFMQTRQKPEGFHLEVDAVPAPGHDPIHYVLDCLERGSPVEGPLSPVVCRVGQQIIETARRSAAEGKILPLIP
jgi:predicted dehydrogenase